MPDVQGQRNGSEQRGLRTTRTVNPLLPRWLRYSHRTPSLRRTLSIPSEHSRQMPHETWFGCSGGSPLIWRWHHAHWTEIGSARLRRFAAWNRVYPTMAEALKIVAISRYKDPAKLSCCAE